MFYTYIIYSESTDSYYTGYTSVGVESRVAKHNKGGNRSTKSGIPWQVVYCKSLRSKTEAIKWENFIKDQKSRQFIEKLINSEENECDIAQQ
ncbi:excinuclease ABC subunit C [Aliifodinibius salipaludis]|uniref:Excinuclease ABC subunit C n=1 Tax=Fodinibius salipaludis TaxID=2032627 RepID=A0A2A2GAN5_9BACT|nr:excinuclease ABC subunit C [Aliifodinibius salipaludis]